MGYLGGQVGGHISHMLFSQIHFVESLPESATVALQIREIILPWHVIHHRHFSPSFFIFNAIWSFCNVREGGFPRILKMRSQPGNAKSAAD